VTPPSFVNAVKGVATSKLNSMLLKNGVKAGTASWAASAAVEQAAKAVTQAGKNKGLYRYLNPTAAGVGSPGASQPGTESTSSRQITGANGAYISKRHKTKFEFGKKSSYATRLAGKMNGTTIVPRYTSDDSSTSNIEKLALRGDFGFNQKLWWFPNQNHYPSNTDASVLFGEASVDRTSRYMLYGMATEEHVKYRIYNSNTYFPINVKINLCSLIDLDLSGPDILDRVANDNLQNQQLSAIPVTYQFTPQGSTNTVLVDPRTQLTNSAGFRQNVTVNTSKTMKLYPGDTWEVTFIRHTGPGWDLLKTTLSQTADPSAAIAWLPIIEAWGVDCEGVDEVDQKSVLGLSPGYLNMEVSKHFKMVNSSTEFSIQDIQGNDVEYLVRAFRKNDQKALLYNVSNDNIVDGPSENGFYIPVITDKLIDFAAPTRPNPEIPANVKTVNPTN